MMGFLWWGGSVTITVGGERSIFLTFIFLYAKLGGSVFSRKY
jgi:hypothetical protein